PAASRRGRSNELSPPTRGGQARYRPLAEGFRDGQSAAVRRTDLPLHRLAVPRLAALERGLEAPRRTLQSARRFRGALHGARRRDRKSTRLNSSHQIISYAVFCLKKKSAT